MGSEKLSAGDALEGALFALILVFLVVSGFTL